MDVFIITVLIVVAVILFLVEVFFIPGISIAGVAAVASLIYANYHAFIYIGPTAGFVTLTISILACVGSLVVFMRSKTLDKVSLKKSIDSRIDKEIEESIKVGDKGISTTRLAMIGYVDFDGKVVEVRSSSEFIDEKTPVTVIRIANGAILVEKDKANIIH